MHQTMLLTIASSDAHPLIDFDLTVIIQLVIFTVMAFSARRMLFQPYLKMRDDRAAGIDGARQEAENLRSEGEARLAEYEQKLAAARIRGQQEQRKMRADAAAHQADVTGKARAEATAAMDEAREQIVSEVEKARAELMPRADELAEGIVSKLLGRKVTQ